MATSEDATAMTGDQPEFRFPSRVAAIREVIGNADFDGLLISNRENRRYLSGFVGSAGYLLITATEARLVTDFRYTEQAALQAPGFEVVQQKGRLSDWFPKLVEASAVERLAFEADDMTVDTVETLRAALARPAAGQAAAGADEGMNRPTPETEPDADAANVAAENATSAAQEPAADGSTDDDVGEKDESIDGSAAVAYAVAIAPAAPEPVAELVPSKGHAGKLRAIKDAVELDALQRAIDVGDAAFAETLSKLRVGMTEREAAWEFEKSIRERGAESLAFDTIVASGPNAARPHHQTGDRQLAEGETIVFDCGAQLDGYCSDLTRTVVLGEPDAAIIRVYSIVLQAQEAAIREARPGMTGEQVDEIARAIIREAGHADDFGHSLGHGLGLEVHEAPHVGPRGDNVLKVGMPFTIEPGIYIPNWGGVRIEDVVVLELDGPRLLSHAPKTRY